MKACSRFSHKRATAKPHAAKPIYFGERHFSSIFFSRSVKESVAERKNFVFKKLSHAWLRLVYESESESPR